MALTPVRNRPSEKVFRLLGNLVSLANRSSSRTFQLKKACEHAGLSTLWLITGAWIQACLDAIPYLKKMIFCLKMS